MSAMFSVHLGDTLRFLQDCLIGQPMDCSVVASLRKRSAEIWRRTFDLLQRESPEYRNSVDEEFTKESKNHCKELLNAIIAVAAGQAEKSGGDPFGFVRTHAEWRARHQVPLARGFLKVLRQHGFGRQVANGLVAGLGVSPDTMEVARLPERLEEARLALEFASGTELLMHFADIDLPGAHYARMR